MGEIRATDVVTAACDALVVGLDSPALRILAACTRAEAEYDVPDLLPPALDELGLTFHPARGVAGQEAAARALAARMLAGELTPRELAFRSISTSGTSCLWPSDSPTWTTITTSLNTATEHRRRSTPMSRPKLFGLHGILGFQPNPRFFAPEADR
ncbi:hypothetical protein [Streptomyces atratus]|uniref:hypothetical protein n=1 Tax=Streptomyces atratus TaxID=1893 RepID=UPI0037A8FED8